jgi:hypothetical protein
MKTWLKVLIVLAVIGILAAVLVYFFVYNKPHTDYEKAKPEMVLTAHALYDSFINDIGSAQETYNGKVLQITGVLDYVEDADGRVFAIFAFGDGMFGPEGVRCTMLENHTEKVKNIPIGTQITIKGFCSGFNDPDVILDHCSFIE